MRKRLTEQEAAEKAVAAKTSRAAADAARKNLSPAAEQRRQRRLRRNQGLAGVARQAKRFLARNTNAKGRNAIGRKVGAKAGKALRAGVGKAASALMPTMAGAGPAGAVGAALMGAVQGLQQAAQQVVGFVQMVNPAVVERLMLAFDNLQAAVGKVLEPLVQVFVPIIRQFGDMVAGYIGVLRPYFEALAAELGALAEVAMAVIEALMPIVEVLLRLAAGVIQELVIPVLLTLAKGLTILGGIVSMVVNALLELFGFAKNRGRDKDQSAAGMAVKTASFSSIQDFSRKSTLAAFRSGDETNVMASMAKDVAEIRAIADWFRSTKSDVKHAAQFTSTMLKHGPFAAYREARRNITRERTGEDGLAGYTDFGRQQILQIRAEEAAKMMTGFAVDKG